MSERQLAGFEANVAVVVLELERFSGSDLDPALDQTLTRCSRAELHPG